MSLSNKAKDLLHSALGSPEAANEVILAIESGSGGTVTPGGSNTQIQFNDSGSFNGSPDLTFDKVTKILSLDGNISFDLAYIPAGWGSPIPSLIFNGESTEAQTAFGMNILTADIIDDSKLPVEFNIGTGHNSIVNSSGGSGTLLLYTGNVFDPGSTTGSGNSLIISGDVYGSGNTGDIFVESGTMYGSGSTGTLHVESGPITPGSSGNGNTGAVGVQSGSVNQGNGHSGNILLRSGDTVGNGNSGDVFLASGVPSGTGASGAIEVTSGTTNASQSGVAIMESGASVSGVTGAARVRSGSSAGNTGDVSLSTGNSSGGNSGTLILSIGTAGGTRGKIQFVNGSEGTVGHVWASTDTNGSGHWALAPFSAANSGDWATSAPTTVKDAIDRLARVVSINGGTPIPL